MAQLELDCRASFGDFTLDLRQSLALRGITALFGPSGSGKSLLLRTVAGLESRASGRVAFDGEDWLGGSRARPLAAHRRGVGVVFQDARLFPHLSVAGNLLYAARRARHVRKSIAFDDVVAALDLAPLLTRQPGSLSGGEAQRAAIARTLLMRPALLLMDEPLAALDMGRKAEILAYIERLPETFGVPILYVSHSLEEVAHLAQDMMVLSQGRIVAVGSVPEIMTRLDLHPMTGRFEAGVVLDGEVVRQDRTFALSEVSVGAQILVVPAVEAEIGARVRLRLRARDIALATEKPKGLSIRNVLPGKVLEIRGEEKTAYAELLVDIGGPRLRARITRKSVHEMGLSPGARVYALVKSVTFDRRLSHRGTPCAPTGTRTRRQEEL